MIPLLSSKYLPDTIQEWASIIPLVTHLANQRNDYLTTGDVALLGRLSPGLIPRLGLLSGYARLLSRGSKVMDCASERGGSSRTVWDVSWGSVFPCANGAATSALINNLLGRSNQSPMRMPEKLHDIVSEKTGASDTTTASYERLSMAKTRRCQVLHVLDFYRTRGRPSLQISLRRLQKSLWYQVLSFVLRMGLAVIFCLLGAYGTAIITVCCAMCDLVAWSIPIERTHGYLSSNEPHNACMLLAAHQNATEWYLLVGDRGVVDSLLNKSMFAVPDGRRQHLAALWFDAAHVLQLVAMTFVAGHKGWDGVALVALIAIQWSSLYIFSRRSVLARYWLHTEGVDAKVRSFQFGGRMALMGAIQIFSESDTTRWMDDIVVPHPRRTAWENCMGGDIWGEGFSERDRQRVKSMAEASLAAAKVLRNEFPKRNESCCIVDP